MHEHDLNHESGCLCDSPSRLKGEQVCVSVCVKPFMSPLTVHQATSVHLYHQSKYTRIHLDNNSVSSVSTDKNLNISI